MTLDDLHADLMQKRELWIGCSLGDEIAGQAAGRMGHFPFDIEEQFALIEINTSYRKSWMTDPFHVGKPFWHYWRAVLLYRVARDEGMEAATLWKLSQP